ncbi:MAG: hypothetical protein A3I01_16800 [Betaproteobacteria bacterium RIFCSPLOWO2_02_FULL_65_24]|nr:MAG: hypothetical protein A3I01_16800 [Betaproteobacteria bacterium RIFCSPLOWO2_02_FULL_65_24]
MGGRLGLGFLPGRLGGLDDRGGKTGEIEVHPALRRRACRRRNRAFRRLRDGAQLPDEPLALQDLHHFEQFGFGVLFQLLLQLRERQLAVDFLEDVAQLPRQKARLPGGFHEPLGGLAEDAAPVHRAVWPRRE